MQTLWKVKNSPALWLSFNAYLSRRYRPVCALLRIEEEEQVFDIFVAPASDSHVLTRASSKESESSDRKQKESLMAAVKMKTG